MTLKEIRSVDNFFPSVKICLWQTNVSNDYRPVKSSIWERSTQDSISRRKHLLALQRSLWFWVRKVIKSKRFRLAREATKILPNTKTQKGGPISVRATIARRLTTKRPLAIGLVNSCGDIVLTLCSTQINIPPWLSHRRIPHLKILRNSTKEKS